MAQVKDLGVRIATLDEKANSLLEMRDEIRMRIPNLLHPSVPVGEDESETLSTPYMEISQNLKV